MACIARIITRHRKRKAWIRRWKYQERLTLRIQCKLGDSVCQPEFMIYPACPDDIEISAVFLSDYSNQVGMRYGCVEH
jgi:hypothetical protein